MLLAYIGAIIYVAAAALTVTKKRQDRLRDEQFARKHRWEQVVLLPTAPDSDEDPNYIADIAALKHMHDLPSGSSAYRDSTK